MLGKLLKYDLKYMIKNMSVFYILSIFFAILSRLLSLLEQTFMIGIITKITTGCMIAMVFNILINTMMRSWVRFNQTIYKDESYLTHTLPVTKNDIYNSEFIQSLIFFFIGFIIIIISLFITYYTKDRWDVIVQFIEGLSKGINTKPYQLIISFFLIVFLEVFNAIQCGFLGIIIGNKSNNNKTAFSVLYGLAAYFVSQTLVLVIMYIVGFFDESIMDAFKSTQVTDLSVFKPLAIYTTFLYFGTITGITVLAKKLFNQGVNIE